MVEQNGRVMNGTQADGARRPVPPTVWTARSRVGSATAVHSGHATSVRRTETASPLRKAAYRAGLAHNGATH